MSTFRLNYQDFILDPQAFALGQTHVIDRGLDWPACTKMGYTEWVQTYRQYGNIKINGLEQDRGLMLLFQTRYGLRAHDCHLFINQLGGASFGWHSDDLDVRLVVVKGRKRVYTNKGAQLVLAGQDIYIPRGCKHRVVSTPGTVALSFGL